MERYTINDLHAEFPTEECCLEWIKNGRWPEGITCAKCERVTKHHKMVARPCYVCDFCGTQVYPMADTIFHKSSTPLQLWFYAMYLMASTRGGISAKQLERELGVTYKTAWRMFKQIRTLLDENDEITLSGPVEADETYVGGKDENRHWNKKSGSRGRGDTGKTIVAGIVERHNRL